MNRKATFALLASTACGGNMATTVSLPESRWQLAELSGADVAPVGDFRFRRDLRAIPNAPSHDVLLVKVSYWLPM